MVRWEEAEYIAKTLKSKFGIEPKFIRSLLSDEYGYYWKWKPRKVNMPCSKCGSNKDVWCLHAHDLLAYYDMYPWGDFHYYFHVCLECGHIDKAEKFWHYSQVEGAVSVRDLWENLAQFKELAEKCPLCGIISPPHGEGSSL